MYIGGTQVRNSRECVLFASILRRHSSLSLSSYSRLDESFSMFLQLRGFALPTIQERKTFDGFSFSFVWFNSMRSLLISQRYVFTRVTGPFFSALVEQFPVFSVAVARSLSLHISLSHIFL